MQKKVNSICTCEPSEGFSSIIYRILNISISLPITILQGLSIISRNQKKSITYSLGARFELYFFYSPRCCIANCKAWRITVFLIAASRIGMILQLVFGNGIQITIYRADHLRRPLYVALIFAGLDVLVMGSTLFVVNATAFGLAANKLSGVVLLAISFVIVLAGVVAVVVSASFGSEADSERTLFDRILGASPFGVVVPGFVGGPPWIVGWKLVSATRDLARSPHLPTRPFDCWLPQLKWTATGITTFREAAVEEPWR